MKTKAFIDFWVFPHTHTSSPLSFLLHLRKKVNVISVRQLLGVLGFISFNKIREDERISRSLCNLNSVVLRYFLGSGFGEL